MNEKLEWLRSWIQIKNLPDGYELIINGEETEIAAEEGRTKAASLELIRKGAAITTDRAGVEMMLADPQMECIWKPHLAPEEDLVIGDMVFRSPAIVFVCGSRMFALIPDLDEIERERRVPHRMDYVEPDRTLYYELGYYVKIEHVYHRKIQERFRLEQGQRLFRFYLVEWDGVNGKRNLAPVADFMWEKFAKRRMLAESSIVSDDKALLSGMEKYAEYTYDWAFNRWGSIVWQQFRLKDEEVGGCVFIVRAAQTPGGGLENHWRERKSLWNQAWFCSLRSAYGYRLWGEHWRSCGGRLPSCDLVAKAALAKAFALSAPQRDGLFPNVYSADSSYRWENGEWGFSNRRPPGHEHYAHLLDMSWTCYWMLKWYEDLERDERLLGYTINYVERLLRLQAPDGSFPAWVHIDSGEPSPYLLNSPETSMHVLLLARLYRITGNKMYLDSAERAMAFVKREIMPCGRWEDFETYWSCSAAWEGKQPGVKDKRSGLYNQCTFSIYWTAEALKELYWATEHRPYLEDGEAVLGELSLYQAVWEPPYMTVPTLGGFGVMNSDDEWNDARQSLFALTYYDYYKITGKEQYRARGLWAMRASFYMMYCPENAVVKKLYENRFPYFGAKEYGFSMENVHHGPDSEHIVGEFTIFDWGNGAACASLAELLFRK